MSHEGAMIGVAVAVGLVIAVVTAIWVWAAVHDGRRNREASRRNEQGGIDL